VTRIFFTFAAALFLVLPRFDFWVCAQSKCDSPNLECEIPQSVEAHRSQAEAYAARGFVEEAIEEYLALLQQQPADLQAKTRVEQLFAQRAPRWLPVEAGALLPFPHGALQLPPAQPGARRGETTSRVLRTTVGFAANETDRQDPFHGWTFGNVDYAYVFNHKASRWSLKVCAHRDEGVALALADNALIALVCYQETARRYLRVDPTRPTGEPIGLWVTARGKPGARSLGHDIYLYAATIERRSTEWLREIAHEYGHMCLPGIGGFVKTDDPWADGDLGELLLVKWLAASGQPDESLWPVKQAEEAARVRRQSLITKARGKPDLARLKGVDAKTRDYFLGLALRVEEQAGPRFLAEALARCPRGRAIDFVNVVNTLARERSISVW